MEQTHFHAHHLLQKEAETERGGHQAPTSHGVHLYSLPYSTFKSLHTDSLLRENESEQPHTILSTGSEQLKIKDLYLIWILRTELQLLSVYAANGQRNRVSNLCAGFPSFTAWMDTTQQWGTAADIHPLWLARTTYGLVPLPCVLFRRDPTHQERIVRLHHLSVSHRDRQRTPHSL